MTRIAILCAALALSATARAHDIYTGVRGKFGNVCCGGKDCSLTKYREAGDQYEFLTREGHWVDVPADRIMFMAIPGDPPHSDSHAAHLCYGPVIGYETSDDLVSGEGQVVHLYCAFIVPGGT